MNARNHSVKPHALRALCLGLGVLSWASGLGSQPALAENRFKTALERLLAELQDEQLWTPPALPILETNEMTAVASVVVSGDTSGEGSSPRRTKAVGKLGEHLSTLPGIKKKDWEGLCKLHAAWEKESKGNAGNDQAEESERAYDARFNEVCGSKNPYSFARYGKVHETMVELKKAYEECVVSQETSQDHKRAANDFMQAVFPWALNPYVFCYFRTGLTVFDKTQIDLGVVNRDAPSVHSAISAKATERLHVYPIEGSNACNFTFSHSNLLNKVTEGVGALQLHRAYAASELMGNDGVLGHLWKSHPDYEEPMDGNVKLSKKDQVIENTDEKLLYMLPQLVQFDGGNKNLLDVLRVTIDRLDGKAKVETNGGNRRPPVVPTDKKNQQPGGKQNENGGNKNQNSPTDDADNNLHLVAVPLGGVGFLGCAYGVAKFAQRVLSPKKSQQQPEAPAEQEYKPEEENV